MGTPISIVQLSYGLISHRVIGLYDQWKENWIIIWN